MAAVASEGAGTVRVAAFASAARRLLPRIWGGPVSLRLIEQEPDLALTSVHRREVDIAVVHSYSLVPRDIPPRCEERVLLEEPVLLAAAGQVSRRFAWPTSRTSRGWCRRRTCRATR